MGKQQSLLALILVLVIGAIFVIATIPVRLGLDLQGGAQLTLQVKTTDKVQTIDDEVLRAVQRVVSNRIDEYGVSETLVQTAGEDKLLVQLPGVNDPKEIEEKLKGTAQLDFRAQKPGTEIEFRARIIDREALQEKALELEKTKDAEAIAKNQVDLLKSEQAIAPLFEKTGLTGDLLRDALAAPVGPGSNSWQIVLNFDKQGGDMFADLTKKIAGTGRSLGIFLDERLLSYPGVDVQYAQTGIVGGSAVISGNFDAKEAQDLAENLRGGALPVPLEIIENRTVGATLGQDSIRSSIYAGLGGLLFVLVFMVVYYRLPGLVADISLVIYSLLTYAAFCILPDFTLTLPGIAGFILSIGMAVDANVLIFERTREELKAGKSLYRSVESGFYRAFSSILDSNVTTLIACLALGVLGSGLVRGFAVTLAIGVCVSMFSAITCSRTLLFFVLGFPGLRKLEYFCPKPEVVR
jgi:preprotein translocase subunit SecD